MIKKMFGKKIMFLWAMALVALAALPVSASAAPIEFDDGTGTGGMDLAIADVIQSAWNFINMFGIWSQLVIGLILVPTLAGFIFWLIGKLPKFKRSAS